MKGCGQMDNFEKSKQISEKMKQCLKTYADLIGTQDPDKKQHYGFIPGLDLSSEAKVLEEQIKKLEEGVFQVMFTGGFSAGKSTLLNALMRKDVLRTAITAETAVITRIIFGQEEKIIVELKERDETTGENKSRMMSVTRFFEDYRVDQDNPQKFNDIDYVVLQQEEEGIGGNLVQLVDSPGTENSEEDTLTARRFANQADAIVHLINGTMPFVEGDKSYISSHYAGKHMRNLFFVINRWDSLNEKERTDTKKAVRKHLAEVFTDEENRFDEELFNSRVFYTAAYPSLMTRLGKPAANVMGHDIFVDDKDTGVPEFEEALSKFLTAEDRDKAAFHSYLSRLAAKYVSAMNTMKTVLDNYRKGIDVLKSEQADFESKRERLENLIRTIEEDCRSCVTNILLSASDEYETTMNRISSGWDTYFQNTKIPFGMLDMLSMVWNEKITGNEANVKKKIKPFADEVQSYVKGHFSLMGDRLSASIEGHLNRLEKQLTLVEQQLDDLEIPLDMGTLKQKLLEGANGRGNVSIDPNGNNINLFQVILGLILLDPETVLGGARGNSSNTQVLVESLMKNVLEFIAIYVVAWPIGLAMIAYRIRQMVKGSQVARNGMASDILKGMKDNTVTALKKEKERYIMELENQISTITKVGKTSADSIRGQVDDYANGLQTTISKLKNQTGNYESEKLRMSKIQEALLKSISDVNIALGSHSLTDEDVRALAVKD